jgi:hypothetical protein
MGYTNNSEASFHYKNFRLGNPLTGEPVGQVGNILNSRGAWYPDAGISQLAIIQANFGYEYARKAINPNNPDYKLVTTSVQNYINDKENNFNNGVTTGAVLGASGISILFPPAAPLAAGAGAGLTGINTLRSGMEAPNREAAKRNAAVGVQIYQFVNTDKQFKNFTVTQKENLTIALMAKAFNTGAMAEVRDGRVIQSGTSYTVNINNTPKTFLNQIIPRNNPEAVRFLQDIRTGKIRVPKDKFNVSASPDPQNLNAGKNQISQPVVTSSGTQIPPTNINAALYRQQVEQLSVQLREQRLAGQQAQGQQPAVRQTGLA